MVVPGNMKWLKASVHAQKRVNGLLCPLSEAFPIAALLLLQLLLDSHYMPK